MLVALLDTSVLWPSCSATSCCRWLRRAFTGRWSAEILAELEYEEARKLVARHGLDHSDATQSAARLVATMRSAFDGAEVTGWEPLVGTYAPAGPRRRALLAAAVVAGAGALVTSNVDLATAGRFTVGCHPACCGATTCVPLFEPGLRHRRPRFHWRDEQDTDGQAMAKVASELQEPLLWLPDLVAGAVAYARAGRGDECLSLLGEAVTVVEASDATCPGQREGRAPDVPREVPASLPTRVVGPARLTVGTADAVVKQDSGSGLP